MAQLDAGVAALLLQMQGQQDQQQLAHQQQLAAMQAQMAAQQAALLQQMAHMVPQAGAAPVAAAAPPRAYKLKLPPLRQFTGSSPPYDEWLASMKQQADYYEIVTDAASRQLIIAQISDAALDWYNHHPDAAQLSARDTLAALRARFQPVSSEDTARAQLHALEQGKHSANDYIASFRRIVVSLPNTDAGTLMLSLIHI